MIKLYKIRFWFSDDSFKTAKISQDQLDEILFKIKRGFDIPLRINENTVINLNLVTMFTWTEIHEN